MTQSSSEGLSLASLLATLTTVARPVSVTVCFAPDEIKQQQEVIIQIIKNTRWKNNIIIIFSALDQVNADQTVLTNSADKL